MSTGIIHLHCIVPPHILKSIAANSKHDQERQAAMESLALSARQRGMREAFTLMGPALSAAHHAVGGKHRTVYDCKHRTRLPGTVVRKEGDGKSDDPAVNEAYDGAGAIYDFYKKI